MWEGETGLQTSLCSFHRSSKRKAHIVGNEIWMPSDVCLSVSWCAPWKTRTSDNSVISLPSLSACARSCVPLYCYSTVCQIWKFIIVCIIASDCWVLRNEEREERKLLYGWVLAFFPFSDESPSSTSPGLDFVTTGKECGRRQLAFCWSPLQSWHSLEEPVVCSTRWSMATCIGTLACPGSFKMVPLRHTVPMFSITFWTSWFVSSGEVVAWSIIYQQQSGIAVFIPTSPNNLEKGCLTSWNFSIFGSIEMLFNH